MKVYLKNSDYMSYKQDIANNNEDHTNISEEKIKELLTVAKGFILSKEYGAALNYFDEIIDRYNHYRLFNEKGFLLIDLEYYEQSVKCFDESLILVENYDAYIGRSLSFFGLYKFDKSNSLYRYEIVENLKSACNLDYNGYLIASKLFTEMGLFYKSSNCLYEFLEKNKNIPQTDNELYLDILKELGNIYLLLNEYKEAYFTFHEILKNDENNIDALMSLGFIAPYLNKFKFAIECYDKILDIDNTIYDAMLFKGELLVSLHRYEEAIDCFNSCPNFYISRDYEKLIDYAKSQLGCEPCNYLGVSKITHKDYKYAYTCILDGFRRFYGEWIYDLKFVVEKEDLPFGLISNQPEFTADDYIACYYLCPNLNTEYNALISNFLNSTFLEAYDKGELDVDIIITAANNSTEEKIIKRIFSLFKSKLKYAHKKNIKYFGVVRSRWHKWSYVDLVKANYVGWNIIHADSLDQLEKKVKESNSLWYKFDE